MKNTTEFTGWIKCVCSGLLTPIVIIIFSLPVFVGLAMQRPQIVGDGSEYVAMYIAFKETHRPWMTDEAYRAYDQYAKNSVDSLVPMEAIRASTPALNINGNGDYNHFWMYSFMAFVTGSIVDVAGYSIRPHSAFIVLHWCLFSIALLTAYIVFKWHGIIALGLIVVGSPTLWYIDKVHTEWLTVCLLASAFMLIGKHRYSVAALFFAICSTQNPSFGLFSLLLISRRFMVIEKYPIGLVTVLLLVSAVFITVVHPVYYLCRYACVTPTMLTGGSALGLNFKFFYVWIADPDIGLLPNWPLGLLLVLMFVGMTWMRKRETFRLAWSELAFFYLTYVAVNLYVQSATNNINSGATTGIARYALWYIPVFCFLIIAVLEWASLVRLRVWLVATSFFLCVIFNLVNNHPRRNQSFDSPTIVSRLIQRHVSWLYEPPPEIFFERYSGWGEIGWGKVLAVVAPDAGKILIIPGNKDAVIVTARSGLVFDEIKLRKFILDRVSERTACFYQPLSEADLGLLVSGIQVGTLYPVGSGSGGLGAAILRGGWDNPENWGTWTREEFAELSIPVPYALYSDKPQQMLIEFRLASFRKNSGSIRQGNNVLWKGSIQDGPIDVQCLVLIEPNQNSVGLSIKIDNPSSPYERGLGYDRRRLGFGLTAIKIGVPVN